MSIGTSVDKVDVTHAVTKNVAKKGYFALSTDRNWKDV